jgi:hypothetical protein
MRIASRHTPTAASSATGTEHSSSIGPSYLHPSCSPPNLHGRDDNSVNPVSSCPPTLSPYLPPPPPGPTHLEYMDRV